MIQLRTRLLLLLSGLLVGLMLMPGTAYAQYSFQDTNLRSIITEIQLETGFRFLYREALISDISLSFESDEKRLFQSLKAELTSYDLSLNVDSTRSQVIIFKQKSGNTPSRRTEVNINGHVVDASTGERLPFATITWQQGENTAGTSANKSGAFRLNRSFTGKKIEMKCSYVGYIPETIEIEPATAQIFDDITFRLQPQRIDGNELVVTGSNYYGQINENASGLVDIGTFNPLGGSNSLRALQALPSVSITPALSGNMHVRGSPADGFQVLVDDITIFNQHHLFGLLDSFNADVLQQSGFFYDIAPAQYQAPPGGTLSLVTKTGSLNKFSSTVGASNTSYRLTLEGPLKKGNSSWLLSGRSSYLNSIDWLNNSDLIKWGLNVDRPRELLDEDLVNVESRLVRPGETYAYFFDLHGKVYVEGEDGSRFIVSGYYGGDNTEQLASRIFRVFRFSSEDTELRNVSTTNNWSNGAISLQYQIRLSDRIYAHSTVGASIYNTEFLKEDFTYTQLNRSNNTFQIFTFPFENRSILNELKAEQQFDLNFDSWLFTAGISYHYYLGEYYEDSFDRPGFLTSRNAHRADFYGQLDYTGFDSIDLYAGSRIHYYNSGNYLRWSPRIKLKLFPQSEVSVGAGYSRNFQFLNKISLSNTVTADVWILANSEQPPTEVDYYSAGIYLEPVNWLYLQAEGYIKNFRNIRLHEINAFSLTNTFNDAPWYSNNSGEGKGLELLLQNRIGKFSLSQTFSISSMQLLNPILNDGEPFYADWDRTYRYGVTLDTEPADNFFVYLSWMYASGSPNKLATFGASNEERLDYYQRMDITAEYKNRLSFGELNISLSVFNVLDRKNPWYRELSFVLDQNSSQNRFRTVPVDVYDIGFQPSFNISASF